MKNNHFILCCLLLLVDSQLPAQNVTFTCSYRGTAEVISSHAFDNDDLYDTYNIEGLVNQILEKFHFPKNKITVQASPQVNNANAAVRNGTPYILYSKYFVESVKRKSHGNWRLLGIFAHEVAHHVLFHTMQHQSSRRDLELEADRWAGAALCELGATLEQATACVKETNRYGSSTHPPRADRLLAVEGGWRKACGNRIKDSDRDGIPDKLDRCKYEKGPRSNNGCPLNPDPFGEQMVYISGGTFRMGDEQGDLWEACRPVHTVRVSSFYMSKYEVTQAQWTEIMGNNPSHFKGCNQCPVEQVNWNDVQQFIRKLNQKTGKNYRLPTEAEWEYAARGGQSYKYAGSNSLNSVAWHSGNSGGKPHPVGRKSPNGYGLYDMSGNVWEWCRDWFGSGYYRNSPSTDPRGPSSGSYRVYRGGGWSSSARNCRVAYRLNLSPTNRSISIGFRLVFVP